VKAAVFQARRVGSETLRFTIEMDADASPITGRLHPEGEQIPFVGWIGLARALEHVLEAGGPPGGGDHATTTPQGGNDGQAPTS
jgi:hypothetical protein